MHEFDSRAFRTACGRFPTGVAVITTRSRDGEKVGFTANSFSSVSLEPPLVLFALGRAADCLGTFEAAGHFAVNILAEQHRELSQTFATPGADKWAGVAYETWETGAPVLTGMLASLDCRTESVLDGGDHRVFIGRVVRLGVGEGRPLVFADGSYRALGPVLGTQPAEQPTGDASHLAGVAPYFQV
jgi:flavin reductase (DIM6/NTAB) family NADH-FMN oxidoreductase RutF